MIRLFRIPKSTNVERVALALAYKGLEVESVVVDPADRRAVREASGQDLVPVLDHDGRVVIDSMEIVRFLEEQHPDPPLYPREPARLAEMLLFIDWFNRAWKRPPNLIDAEFEKNRPDRAEIERLGGMMTRSLDLFEGLLAGRDHLMGDEFSAADVAAFPFLRFGLLHDEEVSYRFHRILIDYQPIGEHHPRLQAWIHRVDQRPRV